MDASTLTRDTSNSFSNTTDPNENGFSSTNCDFALPRGTTQGRGYGGGGGEWDRVSCPPISFFLPFTSPFNNLKTVLSSTSSPSEWSKWSGRLCHRAWSLIICENFSSTKWKKSWLTLQFFTTPLETAILSGWSNARTLLTKMQSELLWSVDQGIPQHQKPFHTERIAKVCEIRHFEIAVQVQHLCPLPSWLPYSADSYDFDLSVE